MKLIHLYVFILTIIFGCSLFKRTTKSEQENHSTSGQQMFTRSLNETDNLKKTQSLTYRHDSVQSAYHLFLWPKGNIKFTPTEGFEGSFDSVLMTVYEDVIRKTGDKLNVESREIAKSDTDKSHEFLVTSSEKKAVNKNFPDVTWLILGFILMIIVGFIVKKRGFFANSEK